MCNQMIFGGNWLLLNQSLYNSSSTIFWQSNAGLGLLIIPTIIEFSTLTKPFLKYQWYQVNIIKKIIQQINKHLIIQPNCDVEGLIVLEKNHPSIEFMEKLIKKYHIYLPMNEKKIKRKTL